MARQVLNSDSQRPFGPTNGGIGSEFGDTWDVAVAKINSMFLEIYTVGTAVLNYGPGVQLVGSTVSVPAGGITNGMLANSLITLGSTAMALGGTYSAINGNLTFGGTVNFSGSFEIGGTAVTLPVSVANGGTGNTTFTGNALIAGNGASALQQIAVNNTATNKFLTQASGFPVAWNTIQNSDLPTPTTSLIGGVKAINSVAHEWIASIDTTGTPQLSQPAFSDISGTVGSSQLPGSFSGFANPSASLGLSAVNGVATTAMRSDAAPALSQSIAPTWTGIHTWSIANAHAIVLDTPSVGQATALQLNSAGTGKWQIAKGVSDDFELFDFAGSRFAIQAFSNGALALMPARTGNVGIGTTAPAGLLDVYGTALFAGGSPWADVTSVRWGADPTGATDSHTAIQNACNYISGLGGGIVFFPPGTYKVTSTITVPGYVRLVGTQSHSCIITSNNADINVITFTANSQQGALENLTISGGQIIAGTFPTNPTILVPPSADIWFVRCEIQGGNGSILNNGQDLHIEGCRVYATCGVYSVYCVGTVAVHQAQFWAHYTSFDSIFPTGINSFPTVINNWAATTAYTAGTLVYVPGVAPGGNAVVVQCSQSGTSGGAFPAIDSTTAMADGSAQWLFCSINACASIRLDSGASECYISQCDITCQIYDYGLLISNNTPAYGVPTSNSFVQTDFGICRTACAVVNACGSLTISNCEIGGGCLSNGAGFDLVGGTNIVITDCTSTNAGSNATWSIVAISTNGVTVSDNTFTAASPAAVAVNIAAGHDYFIVTQNWLNGNSISNGSAGAAHSVVTNNF